MGARYAQRRDQHGDAAQEEYGPAEGEESPQQDDPMLVHNKNKHPDGEEQRADQLADVERPRDVRYIVQEDIGQRRISLHVGHPFVHHDHYERRYPRDEEPVACVVDGTNYN